MLPSAPFQNAQLQLITFSISETNDSHYILLSEILSRDTARVLFPDHLVRLLCDSLLKRFISIRSSCSDNNDNQFGTEKMMSLLKSIQNINSGELSAAIEQALNVSFNHENAF